MDYKFPTDPVFLATLATGTAIFLATILTGIAVVWATFRSPKSALRVQAQINAADDARKRKLDLFRLLFTNQATNLAPMFIQGFNAIRVEYADEPTVLLSWTTLVDHLNTEVGTGDAANEWIKKAALLRASLLSAMSFVLSFNMTAEEVQKRHYYPMGLVTQERLGQDNLQNFHDILVYLKNDGPVPVIVKQEPQVNVEYQPKAKGTSAS